VQLSGSADLRIRAARWRECVCFTDVFFAFCIFRSPHDSAQPFSGTAERILMKLLPNDRGEMKFALSYANGG